MGFDSCRKKAIGFCSRALSQGEVRFSEFIYESDKRFFDRQGILVGAWRFELQASCAQGRRATRLRYAPTVVTSYSTLTYEFVDSPDRLTVPKLCQNKIDFDKIWRIFWHSSSSKLLKTRSGSEAMEWLQRYPLRERQTRSFYFDFHWF